MIKGSLSKRRVGLCSNQWTFTKISLNVSSIDVLSVYHEEMDMKEVAMN
jgi:hypothetical protein